MADGGERSGRRDGEGKRRKRESGETIELG